MLRALSANVLVPERVDATVADGVVMSPVIAAGVPERIEQAFVRNAHIQADARRVDVVDGTATLSGNVGAWAEHDAALAAALRDRRVRRGDRDRHGRRRLPLPFHRGDRAKLVLSSLVAILFGIVMFAKPGDGAPVLPALIAAFALARGAAEVVVSIGGKRMLEHDVKRAVQGTGPQPAFVVSAPRGGASTTGAAPLLG